MTRVSYASIPESLAIFLTENQKEYTSGQIEMAINHPHLMWVSPKNRGLPRSLREAVYKRDNGICKYCSMAVAWFELTVDHIEPVCMGGSNELDNLTVACRSCNSRKGAWCG